MNYYIPHRILVIHDQVDLERQNEVFFKCYQLAFDWANRMGMEGKRVMDLRLIEPEKGSFLNQSSLWCKVECTEEERKAYDELHRLSL